MKVILSISWITILLLGGLIFGFHQAQANTSISEKLRASEVGDEEKKKQQEQESFVSTQQDMNESIIMSEKENEQKAKEIESKSSVSKENEEEELEQVLAITDEGDEESLHAPHQHEATAEEEERILSSQATAMKKAKQLMQSEKPTADQKEEREQEARRNREQEMERLKNKIIAATRNRDEIFIPTIKSDEIPDEFMAIYQTAEKKYGVHWYTLAAVHYVETGFSTHPTMVSSKGALGPMQFIPATWAGWSYDTGGGYVGASLDITNLNVIRKGNGYGVDGNGDGKADPWDVEDAIHTAANYLAKSGYSQNQRKAIFNYNRADWYVDKVLANAENFKSNASYQPTDRNTPYKREGLFIRPTTGVISSGYGLRSLGDHKGIDIANDTGTPIIASADGLVTRAEYSNSYGNVIYIYHPQYDKTTVYAHMSSLVASYGQSVTAGQKIGNMGNTGVSYGSHLHFEVHNGGWSYKGGIDPMPFLK